MLLFGARGWRFEVPNLLAWELWIFETKYFPSGDISCFSSYIPGPGVMTCKVRPLPAKWLKFLTQLFLYLAKKYLPFPLRLKTGPSDYKRKSTWARSRSFQFLLVYLVVFSCHRVASFAQSRFVLVVARSWILVFVRIHERPSDCHLLAALSKSSSLFDFHVLLDFGANLILVGRWRFRDTGDKTQITSWWNRTCGRSREKCSDLCLRWGCRTYRIFL